MAAQRVYIVNQKPNHLLHFILTVCTLGAWAFVWLFITLVYRVKQVYWFFKSS